MITITPIAGGLYRIDSVSGPRSIVVSLTWLNELLRALLDARMIEQGQRAKTPPGQ